MFCPQRTWAGSTYETTTRFDKYALEKIYLETLE